MKICVELKIEIYYKNAFKRIIGIKRLLNLDDKFIDSSIEYYIQKKLAKNSYINIYMYTYLKYKESKNDVKDRIVVFEFPTLYSVLISLIIFDLVT